MDYVKKEDGYLVLCADGEPNASEEVILLLLQHCIETGVEITTTAAALDAEKCRVKILRDGYNGKDCFVHARMAVHKNEILITAQGMDVTGSDCFEALQTKFSADGGRTWTNFTPDEAFGVWYHEDMRMACCDMTPMYHKKTGRFLVTGATVTYEKNGKSPVHSSRQVGLIPYAVFDVETKKFKPRKGMTIPAEYGCYRSGSCQCYEKENGEVLVPIYFMERGEMKKYKAAVLRCTFDGEEMQALEIGNTLEMPNENRGLCEPSVIFFGGMYYLTIRADEHGYVATSKDGLHYSEPKLWTWEDGEILPTYNTQSHWLKNESGLYLVYTRKNGKNDHVMRNRAPLYVGRVNTEKLAIIRESEFVAVPERGARLGNFGTFYDESDTMYVVASEWMQPVGCEAYGSNNALWITDITK